MPNIRKITSGNTKVDPNTLRSVFRERASASDVRNVYTYVPDTSQSALHPLIFISEIVPRDCRRTEIYGGHYDSGRVVPAEH